MNFNFLEIISITQHNIVKKEFISEISPHGYRKPTLLITNPASCRLLITPGGLCPARLVLNCQNTHIE